MQSYIADNRVRRILAVMGQETLTPEKQKKAGITDDELSLVQALGLVEQVWVMEDVRGWKVTWENATPWIEEYNEENAFHKSSAAYWLVVSLLFATLSVGFAIFSVVWK